MKHNDLTMRVFRCRGSFSEHDDRIDHNMKRILQVLDGNKSLASLAFAAGMSMSDFQKAIKALIELNLIISVDTCEAFVD